MPTLSLDHGPDGNLTDTCVPVKLVVSTKKPTGAQGAPVDQNRMRQSAR
jgi:hypothetical protein